MADLRIISYLPNPRLYKATIAARYSGATIEVVGAPPACHLVPPWRACELPARRLTW